MAHWSGRVTVSINGNNPFDVGFQPTWANFRVSGKVGGDTVSHVSLGGTDGTRQNCGSTFADTTGATSFDTNSKVVSHYERVSGTVSEVLNASFVSFGASPNSITLSSTLPNTNYKVTIDCGN